MYLKEICVLDISEIHFTSISSNNFYNQSKQRLKFKFPLFPIFKERKKRSRIKVGSEFDEFYPLKVPFFFQRNILFSSPNHFYFISPLPTESFPFISPLFIFHSSVPTHFYQQIFLLLFLSLGRQHTIIARHCYINQSREEFSCPSYVLHNLFYFPFLYFYYSCSVLKIDRE